MRPGTKGPPVGSGRRESGHATGRRERRQSLRVQGRKESGVRRLGGEGQGSKSGNKDPGLGRSSCRLSYETVLVSNPTLILRSRTSRSPNKFLFRPLGPLQVTGTFLRVLDPTRTRSTGLGLFSELSLETSLRDLQRGPLSGRGAGEGRPGLRRNSRSSLRV